LRAAGPSFLIQRWNDSHENESQNRVPK